ncbi:unnamed protein product [Camellia sinensis]
MMTQLISSSRVKWCDRWNGGRSSRVKWIFKLITKTERSVYLWPYILDWCMFYELEQPAETEFFLADVGWTRGRQITHHLSIPQLLGTLIWFSQSFPILMISFLFFGMNYNSMFLNWFGN